jgi:hypothetical protein
VPYTKKGKTVVDINIVLTNYRGRAGEKEELELEDDSNVDASTEAEDRRHAFVTYQSFMLMTP